MSLLISYILSKMQFTNLQKKKSDMSNTLMFVRRVCQHHSNITKKIT